MKNNIINGYDNLQHNLIDLIREEEAKLGYRKENIRLYYPLSSLCHMFGCDVRDTSYSDMVKQSYVSINTIQHIFIVYVFFCKYIINQDTILFMNGIFFNNNVIIYPHIKIMIQ